MIIFTRTDLTTEQVRRNPTLADIDSTIKTAKLLVGEKIALCEYQKNMIQTDDGFAKGDTFSAPLSTGTAVANTTVADVYKIALPAAAHAVAGDTIWVDIAASGTFLAVPRMAMGSVIPGTTLYSFYEVKGFIILEVKDAAFTAPADVNIVYWRAFTPTAAGGDPLDIQPWDFSTFNDSVAGLILTQ